MNQAAEVEASRLVVRWPGGRLLVGCCVTLCNSVPLFASLPTEGIKSLLRWRNHDTSKVFWPLPGVVLDFTCGGQCCSRDGLLAHVNIGDLPNTKCFAALSRHNSLGKTGSQEWWSWVVGQCCLGETVVFFLDQCDCGGVIFKAGSVYSLKGLSRTTVFGIGLGLKPTRFLLLP